MTRRRRRIMERRGRSATERELAVVHRDVKPDNGGQTPEAWEATWGVHELGGEA